jgi:hypothetical protein
MTVTDRRIHALPGRPFHTAEDRQDAFEAVVAPERTARLGDLIAAIKSLDEII